MPNIGVRKEWYLTKNNDKHHEDNYLRLAIERTNDCFHKTSRYHKYFNFNFNNPYLRDCSSQWTYLNKCECNEYQALVERHAVQEFVKEEDELWTNFRQLASETALTLNKEISKVPPWTHKELMKNTRPHLIGRYQKAFEALKNGYHNTLKKMAPSKAFVKFEKMPASKVEERKPARMIQHRSYEYLYLLKKYVGPLTEELKKSEIKISDTQRMKDIFGIGLSTEKLSARIEETFNNHKSPVILCLDHSKWDGHYNHQIQSVMHEFWSYLTAGKVRQHALLEKLLKLQIHNKGKTQNGLKYEVTGTRLSGEYTTSIENTLANYFILKSVFPTSSIIVCGDDSLVFVDREVFDNIDLSKLPEKMAVFGEETKLEKIAYSLEEIEFCQCSMISLPTGHKMVRNPLRFLGRLSITNHNLNDKQRAKYFCGVALCELASIRGVPILQDLMVRVLNIYGNKSPLKLSRDKEARSVDSLAGLDAISMETRYSFATAFGISVTEQLEIEESIGARYDKDITDYLRKYENFRE